MKKLLILLFVAMVGCNKDSTCIPKPVTKKISVKITFNSDFARDGGIYTAESMPKKDMDNYIINIPKFDLIDTISINKDYVFSAEVPIKDSTIAFKLHIDSDKYITNKLFYDKFIYYKDGLFDTYSIHNNITTVNVELDSYLSAFYLILERKNDGEIYYLNNNIIIPFTWVINDIRLTSIFMLDYKNKAVENEEIYTPENNKIYDIKVFNVNGS